MPRHARPGGTDVGALDDAVRAALSSLEEDDVAALAGVAALLEDDRCDVCEFQLAGEEARRIGSGGAVEGDAALEALVGAPSVTALRLAARAGRTAEQHIGDAGSTAACVVVPLRDGIEVLGTLACASGAGPLAANLDAGVLERVARLCGEALGRASLHARSKEAVRRSQRIASQLHQLIATSISLAGARSELDVLETLAGRVQGVYDGDLAVVTLDSGPAAPLRVAAERRARRGRALDDDEVAALALPALEPPTIEPRRDGAWLVAPILVRRGESRGSVLVRRDGGPFSDDDVEVAALLAQLASSALGAAELHRSIVRSEERLRVLVEAAPVGIVETDVAGEIEWWNRAAAELFGWPVVGEHAIGARPTFPIEVLAGLRELWAEAEGRVPVTGRDLAGVQIADRRHDLAASVATLPATAGRAGSTLSVIEDVTDHRQLMEELRHAQRMEVIGQLSSSVAHDFNNLLTLIAGYAELLTLESVDADRTTQLARDIQATTTRASTLTGKLLTMGRTKSPAPVVFSPVAAVTSIAEVLDRILGADVELRLDLDRETGMIRADQDQFEQMVMNLATNARDAMPSGGVLRLAIQPASLDVTAAGALEVAEGEYVHVAVTDTGEGMDDETARRCFEPLFTTKGPSKGTGLGLPGARRVAVESGGAIEVHSAVGLGTTFDAYFPSAGAAAPAEESPAELAPSDEPATVLLAEDEEGIRRMVGRILSHNRYEVLEAASAEEALEIARGFDGQIDVLVSDVVMAQMSGAELASRLQAERPDLLIVLVSGNVDATVLEGLVAGSSAFLPKPFRPSELIGVLGDLRRQRASAE